jgi:hypothetical protein
MAHGSFGLKRSFSWPAMGKLLYPCSVCWFESQLPRLPRHLHIELLISKNDIDFLKSTTLILEIELYFSNLN